RAPRGRPGPGRRGRRRRDHRGPPPPSPPPIPSPGRLRRTSGASLRASQSPPAANAAMWPACGRGLDSSHTRHRDARLEDTLEPARTAASPTPKGATVARVAIIGGGPAGYEAALVAAQLGADVTLIEETGAGGACVLSDCVPSKTFIAASNVLTEIHESTPMGV